MNAADFLLAEARARGDRPAFSWDGGRIAHGALPDLAARGAGLLAELGAGRGARVLILLSDSIEFVAIYLGALRLGAIAVAFNPQAPISDMARVVEDCGPSVALIEAELAPAWAALSSAVPATLAGRGEIARRLASARPHPGAPAAATDPAFLVYTSGTTGTLKAAIHRHGDVALAARYPREVLGLGPDDVLFATSKLFFAYPLGAILFGTLALGASAVLCDGAPDPANVAAVMARHRPSAVFSVPTAYRNLLAAGVAEGEAFSAVRRYVSAGERLPPALCERWRRATGVEALDAMGTSETVFMLLANAPGAARPGASGFPAPGAELRLADGAGDAVPPGAPGILWARIASVANGYWNRPELSAELFRAGWFKTGDLYRIDEDGAFHHQGRADDMLKIAGQWVSPAEIEELALAAGCRDAALVAAPDADELARAVLFVVPGANAPRDNVANAPQDNAANAPRDDGALAAALSALPAHKRPRAVRCVKEIPRTATGKIQRYKLRAEMERN